MKSLKALMLAAQVGKCAYCGQPLSLRNATYDHVIPRSKGGTNRGGNRVLVCQECNTAKGNRWPTAKQIAVAAHVLAVIRVMRRARKPMRKRKRRT